MERNIQLAHRLGAELSAHEGFTLLAPVQINIVCFALKGVSGDVVEARNNFIAQLNAQGIVRCTATTYAGSAGIRAALVNWMTTEEDIHLALTSLLACRAATDGA